MNLYIEHIDGRILTPEEQSGIVLRSDLRLASEEEKQEAINYFKLHGKCKHHLVYDKPGFDYNFRYCGICNEFISLV